MKVNLPSFVNEYAEYQLKSIDDNPLIQERKKEKAFNTIYDATFLAGIGEITISECMERIARPF